MVVGGGEGEAGRAAGVRRWRKGGEGRMGGTGEGEGHRLPAPEAVPLTPGPRSWGKSHIWSHFPGRKSSSLKIFFLSHLSLGLEQPGWRQAMKGVRERTSSPGEED